jgi:sugar lactone lactonase YvrE
MASPGLEVVATSEVMWTGVAVSEEGRIFVNFPRWGADAAMSVGEIRATGLVSPYPDEEWNAWAPPEDPAGNFVCVQSIYVDRDNYLWVLDAASAYLQGVVPGGAKLVKIDLRKNSVVGTIPFDETVAPAASYLNDVRVDTDKNVAYITDSGLGAIIVVDLATGKARRVLSDNPTTKSENVVLVIEGREWRPGGRAPQVHADGLALDPKGQYLYYQALTGRSLYRIDTRYLRDPGMTDRDLSAKVESLGTTGAADGIEFGPDGYLYLTGIEENAIKVFASLGDSRVLVKDSALRWPDSLAEGPDGYMYVTTSQIHLGADRKQPCKVLRFKVGN